MKPSISRRKAVVAALYLATFGWIDLNAAYDKKHQKPMASLHFQGNIKPDDIMLEFNCTGYLSVRLTVAEVMDALEAVKVGS